MSHYDTLGVEKTATPKEIKAAYRRLARRYHPDMNRGEAAEGAKAMFQEVQTAYDVLSDPERRARYDATGTDKAPLTLADEGRQMLLMLLNQVISGDGDPMAIAQAMLRQAHSDMTDHQTRITRTVARLERRSGRFKVKDGGENLAQMLIEQQLCNALAELAEVEKALAIRNEAVRMLENYEFELAPPPIQTAQTWLTDYSTRV